jgi:hypothetical protein
MKRRFNSIFTFLETLFLFVFFGTVSSANDLQLPSFQPDMVQVKRLSRSINLLKSATETYHPEVRIMIYGQSHSLGEWPGYLIANIKQAYPHARIVWTNKAVVAFSSMLLSRSVKADVVPWQPDLLFLHCLGDDQEDYHRLYSTVSKFCTADVVVQADHVNTKGGSLESLDVSEIGPDSKPVLRNYHWLPEIVNQYKFCWADIRTPWKEYLVSNNIFYLDLLRDGFHCNDRGHHLTAHLLSQFLIPKSDFESIDPLNYSKVRTSELRKDIALSGDHLPVRFTGNRVDVIYEETAPFNTPVYDYTLDSKIPDEVQSLYDFDRASFTWGLPWPGILGADHVTMPNEERWTIYTKSISLVTGQVFFSVEGSKTGPDGEGSNFFFPFVSNSGRLKIEPQAFMQGLAYMYSQQEPPADWKITVDCVLRAVRSFRPRPWLEKGAEVSETLFLSSDDQKHELNIKSKIAGIVGIKALRVYSPSGQAAIEILAPPVSSGLVAEMRGDQVVISWLEIVGSGRLQVSKNVGEAAVWSSVNAVPELKNHRFEIIVSAGLADRLFYRIGQ